MVLSLNQFQPFDFEILRRKFFVTENDIEAAGFSVESLGELYNNYTEQFESIDNIRQQFLAEYFLKPVAGAHSVSSRTKDPYHLVEKVIRKKNNNNQKYNELDVTNYHKFVTDLIGVRILMVYKADWEKVHRFLVGTFENDESNYITEDTYVSAFDDNPDHYYIAERPVAYIRAGDDRHFYEGHSDIKIKDKTGYYRSVHYIIKYKGYYIELQVRSIFEEAWGEVDHDVLYPLFKDNQQLVRYSMMLNRLSGLADEMSDYFKQYCANVTGNVEPTFSYLDVPDGVVADNPVHGESVRSVNQSVNSAEPTSMEEVLSDLLDQ